MKYTASQVVVFVLVTKLWLTLYPWTLAWNSSVHGFPRLEWSLLNAYNSKHERETMNKKSVKWLVTHWIYYHTSR